ncbi:MAG: hypothetical protein RMN51_05660 [Verrucomicrobiota bacterium]|nr:hypothetical protein [Verrucomicrobiota bacterium]
MGATIGGAGRAITSVLQQRLNLASGAWANAPSGWTNPVTVPVTLPTKFYRLFKP